MSIDGVKFEEPGLAARGRILGHRRQDLLKNKRTTSRHIDLHYAA
jgi:hypothetical protein